MKYAVISDIHANLQALESVLKDAEAQGAEKVVCLGDVVGYGPLPAETLRRIRSAAETVLAGNHDDAVSGRISDDDFIDLAAEAVKRHRQALSEEELAWLRALPYTAELEGAVASHGDFVNPQAFNYMMDGDTVAANLRASDAQLMFVGHTHVPCVYLVGRSGKIYRIDPEDFTLEGHKRYIVNPGSVGYPRENKGQCYSSYVLYDSTLHTIQFRLLPFTVASVMQRGTAQKSVRMKLIAAAALAAAVVSGAAGFLLSHRDEKIVEKETVIEKHFYEEDPTLTIVRKTLTLPKNARCVRAGYRIERGTDLADLHVVFRTADGTVIQALKYTPKGSANQPIKIPENSISAEFVIRRLAPDDNPRIRSFDPTWE